MANEYTASIKVQCWKEHECSTCGTRYRYRFERKMQGKGADRRAATANATTAAVQAVKADVDLRPCPGCGFFQPDMICSWRAWWHALIALIGALVTGHWNIQQIYNHAYFPIAGTMWVLGALGRLPRVKPSTAGEGHERRYFYGTAWAVLIAQPMLFVLWKVLPQGFSADVIKLLVFTGILATVGWCARLGLLPRTRPIVPGELAVSD